MADLLLAVKNQLKWDEIDRDNWVFKLFSRFSVAFCLAGSALCAATQYFGTPITCNYKGEDSLGPLLHQYCWIHGSYYISEDYQDHFGCITDQATVTKDSDTSYYQWVVFMLLLNALLFIIPHKIWRIMESGIMVQFGNEAKSVALLADEEELKSKVQKYARYFVILRNRTNAYFYKFLMCECLNVLMLVLNFLLTDKFLSHKFRTYGFDVLHFYGLSDEVRMESVNPMCNAFPTKTSCDVKNVGPTSQGQTINAICILSQNIVNEKVYLALWFWYIFLFIISAVYATFRLAQLFLPQLRAFILASRAGGAREIDRIVRKAIRNVSIGDWFVLSQLGKNTDVLFFRELLETMMVNVRTEDEMNFCETLRLKPF